MSGPPTSRSAMSWDGLRGGAGWRDLKPQWWGLWIGIDTRRMARGGYTLRKRAPELARETREKLLEVPTAFALLGAYVNVVCVCMCVCVYVCVCVCVCVCIVNDKSRKCGL